MFDALTLFAARCTDTTFFGLRSWYYYLNEAGKMEVVNGRCQMSDSFMFPGDLALVALAILDIVLRLAGFVAIGYVIYGGFRLLTSQGDPEASKQARQTIINAIIGLIIALFATAFVAFIGTRLA